MRNLKQKILLKGKIPIRLIDEPYCRKCMNIVGQNQEFCDFCIEPPPGGIEWYFNKIIALGHYFTYKNKPYLNIPYNILSRMILILKGEVKKQKLKVGEFLAEGLWEIIQENPFLIKDTKYILIAPKNDPSQENQCSFILKPILEILKKDNINLKDISDSVIKTRNTKENKLLLRDERFINVKGSHEINIENLKGNNVLVLEDVVTTGATTWDISRALKEKYAGEINILSLGRTLFESDIVLFKHELNFNELLIYFSNLDIILDLEKIQQVNINSYQLTEEEINWSSEDYEIKIDYLNKQIKHNCNNYLIRRYKKKCFCKHLIKLFLRIREDYGESSAYEYLNSIYSNLLDWEFIRA